MFGNEFIQHSHACGLPTALQKRRPGIREQIKHGLRGLDVSLFDADAIYQQWPDALKSLDFLKPG